MTLAPSPAPESSGPVEDSITSLLVQLSQGNHEAESRLIQQVYGELRRLARKYMRRERPDHSLQPTALVNEVYLRLVAQQPPVDWQGRAHFFAVAAQLMRRILVDHARARLAEKRGGGDARVTFSEALGSSGRKTEDILAIHEAIEELEKLSSRQARVVELRFFGGLSFEEIALVLNTSERTAKRDWNFARAWLHGRLK